jgi:hypothetical protein
MSQELEYKVVIKTDKLDPSDLIDPDAVRSLAELNNEIEQYRSILKQANDAKSKGIKLSDEDIIRIERVKGRLKETNNEYQRQQRELVKLNAGNKELGNTYNDLVTRNSALSAEMRAIPFDDTTNKLEKLREEYVANNEKLKDFDTRMGNHQRNVGNYSSGLQNLGKILSKLPGPLGQAGQSVTKIASATSAATTAASGAKNGFSALFAVIRANPLGVFITIAAGVIAILSKVKPITDLVEKAFAVLGATLDTVTQFIGAFISGTDTSTISLTENTKASLDNIKAKERLAQAEIGLIKGTAQHIANIKNLKLRLDDENLSLDEKRNLLQDIEIEEQALLGVQIENAKIQEAAAQANFNTLIGKKEQVEAEKELAQATVSRKALEQDLFLRQSTDIQSVTELEEEAAEKKLESDEKIAEERRKQAEKEKKYLEEKAAREKQVNEAKLADIDALQEEIRKAEQQFLDELPELDLDISDREKVQLERAYNLGEELAQQTIQQAIRTGDQLLALELQQAEELRQQKLYYLSKDFSDEEAAQMAIDDMIVRHTKEKEDKIVEIEKNSAKTKEDIALNVASNAISIGTSLFGKSKALSVAQAIIDTYAAANNAAKNTEGGVFVKAIAAAAVIAAGLANVKKILSTKIGSGSMSAGSTATVGASTANIATTQASILTPRASITELGVLSRMQGAKERFSGTQEPRITVTANVDRRGLAIAVRDGERSIRTQQYDFK